ncbi:hypothetical protein CLV47_12341 [Antricoccus suffuscus]|uniref:TrbC/VIRB2 family protein n=1 Tax=Antricoccus suffuscus TaxID=1629062 RepID=A0A2T0ZEM5_9ACTN|nr:hypothetical protein [Antricoccus suffuscus]PRZ34809.1 hypothetical protein CLV47_12341 [Antricoccus suffuscus]
MLLIAQRLYSTVIADDIVPPLDPTQGKDAPGLTGLAKLMNNLAVYALYIAVISVILGIVIAVAGPRIGFHHAKALGVGGVVGGFVIGIVVALSRTTVLSGYDWFATA